MSSGCASSTAAASSAPNSGPASAATRARRSASLESWPRPALDERADAHRLRQAAAVRRDRRGAARQHQVLQRLEREHRVAAGVAQQRRRERVAAQLGEADRFDQRRELRQVERLQDAGLEAGRLLERRAQRGRRRARLRRPLREAPLQRGERVGLRERLQELEARRVGEVQVVDDERGEAVAERVGERRVDGALQQKPLRVAGARDRGAELGQHERELGVRVGAELERMRRAHRAQQARQQRVGDAGVARPRLDRDDAVAPGANSWSSRLLPMPASPTSRKARRFAHACASACSSRSRPIRRGGRSRLAGAVLRRAGRAAPPRSIVASSSIVSADGRVPSSSFRRRSRRSNAAIAAARSPRR
jgi:hypothetical protein